MTSIDLDGLEVAIYRSEEDGSLVVDITGPGDDDLNDDLSPILRVWLNEACIYDNPRRKDQ